MLLGRRGHGGRGGFFLLLMLVDQVAGFAQDHNGCQYPRVTKIKFIFLQAFPFSNTRLSNYGYRVCPLKGSVGMVAILDKQDYE